MGINTIAKKILGKKGTQNLVLCKKSLRLIKSMLIGTKNRIEIKQTDGYQSYYVKGKNVFFGYYDLKSYNSSGDKLIGHMVNKKANPTVDPAKIVFFNIGNNCPHVVGETRAWCWQQGARLRWHPTEADVILFNDYDNNQYVLRKVDIKSGRSEIIGSAVYDVDNEFRYAVTLNFSRLQSLRPGYGYLNMTDPNEKIKAPSNDGVYLVDIKSGAKELIYSLNELAKTVDDDGYHYINHISIAPNGKNFIFFHLWTNGESWKMRLYASDIIGTRLTRVTDGIVVSHYCWMDNENLIITTTSGKYLYININSCAQSKIEESHLNRDGHPNKFGNGFISDTYPLKNQLQKVFYCGLDGTGYREIASVFADPFKYGEHRCDLHPRVEHDGRITIDTTAIGGVRSILAFEID